MADGGDGLVDGGELPHQLDHAIVQAQVFGRPAADNDQGIVVGLSNLGKARVERKVVPRLLGVSLVAFEVMDGGAHALAGLLVGADGMDLMAHGLQRLEGHHGLVVLGEVTHQHQNSLRSHPLVLLSAVEWNQAVAAI